ncbi:hypothetical protein PM082_010604 [Marasmius tenuissimus]|nr:hypothetical protein PM082_010604 [Marasmius tenuissimus]
MVFKVALCCGSITFLVRRLGVSAEPKTRGICARVSCGSVTQRGLYCLYPYEFFNLQSRRLRYLISPSLSSDNKLLETMAKRRKTASKVAQTESFVKHEEKDISLDLPENEDEDKQKEVVLVKKEEEMAQELDLIQKRVEARRALREMRNDKLKVKEETDKDFLDPLRAMDIISIIPAHAISVDDDLDINATVTHVHLSTKFGGNPQKTYPDFSKENKKKLTDMGFAGIPWQCPTPEFNPYMPSIPGKPGLYFSEQALNKDLTPNYQWPETSYRVIGSTWAIIKMEFSSKLTVEEWRGL